MKWQPEIKIMDANLLACPDHENLIEQLIRSRAWVDFSQGLDIRLVNRDNVSLLNRVRIKAVHFAWDNPDEDLTGYFQRFLDLTALRAAASGACMFLPTTAALTNRIYTA